MFPIPFTKGADAPTSAQIAERIAASRRKISDAETRVPALRAEDGDLEAQIARLIGRQIAEGADTSAEVAKLRARRSVIATRIEELQGEAGVAAVGIAEAERREASARWREVRTEANAVREELIPLLERAERALRDLADVDPRITALASKEMTLWKKETAIRDSLGAPTQETPPSSNVTQSVPLGHSILDLAFEALVAGSADKLNRGIGRIQDARARAEAANRQPLP